MRVSVVICTYNRADGLRATLECLKQQRHRGFEVVVVNGPSTDHTTDVLAEFGGRLKVVDNPLANLSISRNLGIRAAAGDVVAFIDDDALPEPAWLEQALPAFDAPEVVGVGGIVIDHTGLKLQYRYSLASRYGEATFTDVRPSDSHCVPGSAVFPYLQGTNALFRRSALAEIGLFDEVFDFYLDETDVCCRLVDRGYILRELPVAPVHHKYLPSNRRNTSKVVTNWTSIVRNFVYFGYRHALPVASESAVLDKAYEFAERALQDARYHEELGAVDPGHADRTHAACGPAIADGIALGRERVNLRMPPAQLDPPPFVRYLDDLPADAPAPLKIVLVSSGYTPNVTGGIARFVSDVAPELARRGHEVRVITRTQDVGRVDLEDGVWVHRLALADLPGLLPEAPDHVDGFATAVASELDRIADWWRPDIAYGSLWDVELLGIARNDPSIPVVPMLATPVAEVAEHEGWLDPAHPSNRSILGMIALERELIEKSTMVHAISDAIVVTMNRLYPGALDSAEVSIAHIGSADAAGTGYRPPAETATVLFVGRLEPRKGIHTFLDAAERLLGGHDDVRVVVAGDASRSDETGVPYPQQWTNRRVPAGEKLSFMGVVDDETLQDLISSAQVVVMPSRYESFGLVVVEAMTHARAVVASDIGGIREIVLAGETGLLVPVGDPVALADAIGALVGDRARAIEMGRLGRRHFDEHLSIGAAAGRLEGVLRRGVRSRQSLGVG